MIGSGASGLAAAVSARAGREHASRSRRRDRCSRATRRRRRAGSRPHSARRTRQSSTPQDVWTLEPRDGRHAALSRRSPPRRRARSTGSRSSASSSPGENGGYRLARCGGASQKRLLQVGDRTGHAITKALREAWEGGSGTSFENSPLRELERDRERLARDVRRARDRRGHRRPRRGRPLLRVAQERGELSTNHPGATGEVTRIALGLGAEARDLDALQYHPNGGAWPSNMQGYSIPETTRAYGAVLLERGRRGVHRLARPARRRRAGDRRRGRGRVAASRPPMAGLPSTSTRRESPRPTPSISLPYMLRRYRGRRHRPAGREDPHLPGPPLPERRSRDRHRLRDHARGRSTPAARSPAAPTGAIG